MVEVFVRVGGRKNPEPSCLNIVWIVETSAAPFSFASDNASHMPDAATLVVGRIGKIK